MDGEDREDNGEVPGFDDSKQAVLALSARVIGVIAIVVALALTALAAKTIAEVIDLRHHAVVNEQRYIACEDAIDELKSASDYLTAESRLYILTGDDQHLQNYVNEVYTSDRRGHAEAVFESNLTDQAAFANLRKALENSDDLAAVETRAVRLAAESYGDDMPDELLGVALEQRYLDLSRPAKLEKAKQLVLSTNYIQAKERIDTNAETGAVELVESLQRTIASDEERLDRLLDQVRNVVMLLAALVATVIVIMFFLVFWPLNAYVAHIRQNEELAPRGGSELRYFAHAYNAMFQENARHAARLQHAAERDPLTGLNNRRSYDAFMEEAGEDIALLIIDVDHFKEFNDRYGHDVGDAVLKKVAGAVTHSFRSSDFPCRIGGDEFAVVMTGVNPSLHDVVVKRIEAMRAALADESDGLPSVTLSIGVAFGRESCEGLDVFRAADRALYSVKQRGRNGYAFDGE